jgi:hypothetical protein
MKIGSVKHGGYPVRGVILGADRRMLGLQKLKDNNVEDTDIMQISGNKSVQSVRNYSAISEGKHKRISNVLAGAE